MEESDRQINRAILAGLNRLAQRLTPGAIVVANFASAGEAEEQPSGRPKNKNAPSRRRQSCGQVTPG